MAFWSARIGRVLMASVGTGALVGGLAGPGVAQAAGAGPSAAGIEHRNVHVCGRPAAGSASCDAIVHQAVRADGKPAPNASSPTGLSPSQLEAAYGIPGAATAGSGETIALVDAYDDPTIANDLATFDSQYGLPQASFSKVNQTGGTKMPSANSGWALEISLDVEWAHAIAPAAKILLVEATTSSFTNLLAAEDYASGHAQYVSNSWGGSEFSGESTYDSHFSATGVSYFVSAGDSGIPAEYPSASPKVISVGGTSLAFNSDGTITETGWSSSGGGCSAYEQATSSQISYLNQNAHTGSCSGMRGTPDVASDADPNSGLSVYDSTVYSGQSGWFTVGGTSAAAPVWAARSAGTASPVTASTVYGGSTIPFYDVTVGNNGDPAGPGYDLVTGMGTWVGSGATTRSAGSTSGGGGSTSVTVHVAVIGPYSASGKAMLIPVGIADTNGNPVSGATVTIQITGPVTATGSASTGSNGTVTFKLSHAPKGTYTTTVTNVSGSNLTWDQAGGSDSYTGSF
ncbi:MAG: Ig-like domain-containing protein [Actinomycetota bacterium]|nr:Ig-like domain-containing protein [Actinomycetota bacterium]